LRAQSLQRALQFGTSDVRRHADVSSDAREHEDPAKTDAAFAADIPLGRVAQADEIAALVAYLLGDDSRFVTGAEMVIDGGMTAR